MIKVSVMYANEPGARFDHDYYKDKHMPMIQARLGEHCKYYTIQGARRRRAGSCADLYRHLSCLQRVGRKLSGWIRSARRGNLYGYKGLHRPASDHPGQRGRRMIFGCQGRVALLSGAPSMRRSQFDARSLT
jgi:hypothetical protein